MLARSPYMLHLPATKCQHEEVGGGCPQVNKFKQVSSLGQQMSLVGSGARGSLYSGGVPVLYGEVQG